MLRTVGVWQLLAWLVGSGQAVIGGGAAGMGMEYCDCDASARWVAGGGVFWKSPYDGCWQLLAWLGWSGQAGTGGRADRIGR